MPPVGKMAQPKYQWPSTTIPHAKQFRLNEDFSDPTSHLSHMMPSEQHFIEAARKLGINQDSQIVVYDSYGLFSAARAWWMFKAMGHKAVAILDGGLPAWIAAGHSVVQAHETNCEAGNFVGAYQQKYFCHSEDVLNSLENTEVVIVDARAQGRFYGRESEPRAGMRSGHMPNAINLPYGNLLNNGVFKSKSELEIILTPITLNKKAAITSCGSGVTACILALALALIGFDNIRVYDGSWSEWGASQRFPVVTD